MQNVQKEELLKYNKPSQMTMLILCLKEKQKELKVPPKFVLIKISKEIDYLFEDSSILIDKKHQEMLIKWILEANDIPKQESKMIYKASKDGYTAKKFHELCDNTLNTTTIIKANDFIFGGFTSVSWHPSGTHEGYKRDPKAFIFSISNPSDKPIKFESVDGNAIHCDNRYGPIFGKGCEICIKDNCNVIGSSSFSNMGYSYKNKDHPITFLSFEGQHFLCGKYQYEVQEIEVYQLF